MFFYIQRSEASDAGQNKFCVIGILRAGFGNIEVFAMSSGYSTLAALKSLFALSNGWRPSFSQLNFGPNQAPEPTPTSVTPAAIAPVAPAAVVAHL